MFSSSNCWPELPASQSETSIQAEKVSRRAAGNNALLVDTSAGRYLPTHWLDLKVVPENPPVLHRAGLQEAVCPDLCRRALEGLPLIRRVIFLAAALQ